MKEVEFWMKKKTKNRLSRFNKLSYVTSSWIDKLLSHLFEIKEEEKRKNKREIMRTILKFSHLRVDQVNIKKLYNDA